MFLEKIGEQIITYPKRIAVKNAAGALTYDAFGQLVNQMASRFSAYGFNHKVPVIIFAGKELWAPAAFIALAALGVPYLPVDSSTPSLRLLEIISLANAQLLVCAQELPDCPIAQCPINSQMMLEQPNSAPDILTNLVRQEPDQILYVIFTSGSTGNPKGIPITHDNLQAFLDWLGKQPGFALQNGKTVLGQAQFSFDLSVTELYYTLTTGGTLHLLERETQQDYPRLFDVLAKSEAEIAVFTPSFARYLLRDRSFYAALLPKLETIFFCGEPLPIKTVQQLHGRFPGMRVLNAYGPTETTVAVCAFEVPVDWDGPEIPIAQGMLPHIWIGNEAGMTFPAGEIGELIIGGAQVSPGYLDGTQGGFFANQGLRAYRTGDLGVVRDGYLYCLGRRDRQIKRMGYRIEPLEIELALEQEPSVSHAAVIMHQNRLTAIIQPEGSTPPQIAVLRHALQKKLAPYMIPELFYFLSQMPLNTNGKCDYKKLKELMVSD